MERNEWIQSSEPSLDFLPRLSYMTLLNPIVIIEIIMGDPADLPCPARIPANVRHASRLCYTMCCSVATAPPRRAREFRVVVDS